LHTRPAGPHATREPLQFGAEIFGHAGIEADLEVQELALDGLKATGVDGLVCDLADVRLLDGVLSGLGVAEQLAPAMKAELLAALAAKDAASIRELLAAMPDGVGATLAELTTMYGGDEVLTRAREVLPANPLVEQALSELAWLATQLRQAHPEVRIGFDLSDLSGYAYYSGSRFAVYAQGCSHAVLRGGRYDEVGAIFGRRRPAVGFSLDLKVVAELLAGLADSPVDEAIRAPWSQDPALRQAIRQLRQQGLTVVSVLPGHEEEVQEFNCTQELVQVNGQWTVRAR